jgi:hypothetical protein
VCVCVWGGGGVGVWGVGGMGTGGGMGYGVEESERVREGELVSGICKWRECA